MTIEAVTGRIQPNRCIEGMSAVLLSFNAAGEHDYNALLRSLSGPEVIVLYRQVTAGSECLLALELGQQFAPFGCTYDVDTVRGIMEVEAAAGLKHSSLGRRHEWQRLARRDRAVLADIAAHIQEWIDGKSKM